MSAKRDEMRNAVMSVELLLICKDYSEYMLNNLVKRTVKTKIESFTKSFVGMRMNSTYKKSEMVDISIDDQWAIYPLLDNAVIDDQIAALKSFEDMCEEVLDKYTNNRVTVTHYISLVEDRIAEAAYGLMAFTRAGRVADKRVL